MTNNDYNTSRKSINTLQIFYVVKYPTCAIQTVHITELHMYSGFVVTQSCHLNVMPRAHHSVMALQATCMHKIFNLSELVL